MRALLQPANIIKGKELITLEIPSSLKHAPAEQVLIFKAEEKGVSLTKEKQQKFRNDIREVIGKELMSSIDVIRPTRHGGHTLIFQSAIAREKVLEVFRANEKKTDVTEDRSCIIAPKKKYAKVMCCDPPDDISISKVLQDMFERNNPQLQKILIELRDMKILDTRFGWIFEISSLEAAAIQTQGGRICFDIARKMRVKEYILIQQCYNCCGFGHSAKFCQMKVACCRLYGAIGHAGWDCPDKEDKQRWRCANCIYSNEVKGMNLATEHAAAQLHKCPCALTHKAMRKAQLISKGIYTVPEDSSN